jgi:signal transduction histidine kinase
MQSARRWNGRDEGAGTPITRVRPDVRSVVLLGVLGLVTLATALTSAPFAVYEPQLDIALLTAGTVVSLAVAMLSHARYREQGVGEGLLEASAFLVLAVANLANLVVIIANVDDEVGLTLGAPGQLPLYYWAAARLASAGLLATGAIVGTVAVRDRGRAALLLWGPTVALVAGGVLLWLARDWVPVLVDPSTLERLADETFATTPLPGINVGILLLDGLAALLLVAASVAYSRSERGAAGIPREYLVPALVVAVFSQVHYILYPAVYSGLVSTGDLLRVASYLVLAAGLQAGARRDLQEVRQANARLRLLATAEADRAAIAERARLARELHDGIAQDLWTAKLELDRLGEYLEGEDQAVAGQLERTQQAVEAARAEAQDAVHALRAGFDAGLSLQEELPRRLDAFTARTGYLVDLELDPHVVATGVLANEMLRVLDEALHNVEKHADATRIRVRVHRTNGELVLLVEDNGVGFERAGSLPGHGLLGMRERAAVLHGRLEIRSAPGDGTSVRLAVPDTSAGIPA